MISICFFQLHLGFIHLLMVAYGHELKQNLTDGKKIFLVFIACRSYIYTLVQFSQIICTRCVSVCRLRLRRDVGKSMTSDYVFDCVCGKTGSHGCPTAAENSPAEVIKTTAKQTHSSAEPQKGTRLYSGSE